MFKTSADGFHFSIIDFIVIWSNESFGINRRTEIERRTGRGKKPIMTSVKYQTQIYWGKEIDEKAKVVIVPSFRRASLSPVTEDTRLSWWRCRPQGWCPGFPAAPSPSYPPGPSWLLFSIWKRPICRSRGPASRKSSSRTLRGCWEPWWSWRSPTEGPSVCRAAWMTQHIPPCCCINTLMEEVLWELSGGAGNCT